MTTTRNARSKPDRVPQVGHERPQIAIVDSHQRGADFQYPIEIVRIIDFDQRFHPQLAGVEIEIAQPAVIEAFGDQQDAIGAGEAGFQDLISLEQKIFPQDRN